MTNFKQTPRNITLQHISIAEAATRQNKEVERSGGSRGDDHSNADDPTTSTYEKRDVSIGSGPTSPLIGSTEQANADNYTSSEREAEGSRQDSGSSDSESGFSSSSSEPAEVEVTRVDPQPSRMPTRAVNGVGYEETGMGHLDVPMKRPRNVDWVADELMQVKSVYRFGAELPVLAKRINEASGRVFKVEGMKDHEHVASWAGKFKFTMYNLVVKEMNITPPTLLPSNKLLWRGWISPHHNFTPMGGLS